jgi:PAS domain S-box-containing protein
MTDTAEHLELQQSHILVVDDDTSVCDMYRSGLERSGYVVHTAYSYHEAVAIMRKQVIDVVVSDIFLGEMNGLDVLEQSSRRNPDVPVVLVTGLPTVETASAAVRLKAYEYLPKPVSIDKLIGTVGRAVQLRSMREARKRLEIQKHNYQRDLEDLVAARTKKLIESTQRFELLFANSKDAIFMAAWDGTFTALNQSSLQLFGYEQDELMDLSVPALYADAGQWRAFAQEIERSEFVKDFEVQFKKKDGSIIDCLLTAHLLKNGDGRIEGYQGIVRDITAQKEAQKKIRDQNTFLNNVIESLSHPFMVIDAADFQIKIANKAARGDQQVQGQTCHSLIHNLDRPCFHEGCDCPLENVVQTGRPVHTEHMHCNHQGQESKHEVHAFPLFDACGKVKQVIQYFIDITQKKRLEAIAEAANLMDNLGFIFSGIRHEIGNPLNSVKMALSVLSMNLDRYSRETIREFVGRALSEASRVEYLLKALKNFSMFESPNVEPVSIKLFMHNFTALVEKDFANQGIRINLDLPSRDTLVLTDHRALHQVMLNLMTNAGDALKDRDNARIDIGVDTLPGYVKIEVSDNGCGITLDDQRNLFRPFYTSKPNGTGLGLVIVKKMLAKMDSSIRIESIHQQGTTVTMVIPRPTAQEDHDTG